MHQNAWQAVISDRYQDPPRLQKAAIGATYESIITITVIPKIWEADWYTSIYYPANLFIIFGAVYAAICILTKMVIISIYLELCNVWLRRFLKALL